LNLSVSVRVAFECLVFWGIALVGLASAGKSAGIGSAFHLSDQFVLNQAGCPLGRANHPSEIEAIAPVLQQLFYELVFTSSNHSNRQSTSTASTLAS